MVLLLAWILTHSLCAGPAFASPYTEAKDLYGKDASKAQEVKSLLEKEIKANPGNAGARALLGKMYCGAGELEKAVGQFNAINPAALFDEGESAGLDTLLLWADALKRLGRNQEAADLLLLYEDRFQGAEEYRARFLKTREEIQAAMGRSSPPAAGAAPGPALSAPGAVPESPGQAVASGAKTKVPPAEELARREERKAAATTAISYLKNTEGLEGKNLLAIVVDHVNLFKAKTDDDLAFYLLPVPDANQPMAVHVVVDESAVDSWTCVYLENGQPVGLVKRPKQRLLPGQSMLFGRGGTDPVSLIKGVLGKNGLAPEKFKLALFPRSIAFEAVEGVMPMAPPLASALGWATAMLVPGDGGAPLAVFLDMSNRQAAGWLIPGASGVKAGLSFETDLITTSSGEAIEVFKVTVTGK
jgi:tetratricopeptide (TPR) repeat protein